MTKGAPLLVCLTRLPSLHNSLRKFTTCSYNLNDSTFYRQ
jgi:hypothetical protein